ncbi:uncharacterized protein LOC108665395 [Hyalella azteca]|uniref:Uncharacterized protein LOC108665395 n=1 Tax=Hyalella azteca TaxID=294128 RepID=A0A8B7N2G5_HYAAZ|nr:uncharacterized protein LOC108665395 [Hyalella azteca]
MCYSTCVGNTVKLQDGTEVTDLPKKALGCIGSDLHPYIWKASIGQSFCEAQATCALVFGVALAPIDTPENLNFLMAAVNDESNSAIPHFWVNVRYIDGAWVRMPSKTPVPADMWDGSPSDTSSCVVILKSGKLTTVPCSIKLIYMCIDATKTFKPCE